jgi:hypothetical protein
MTHWLKGVDDVGDAFIPSEIELFATSDRRRAMDLNDERFFVLCRPECLSAREAVGIENVRSASPMAAAGTISPLPSGLGSDREGFFAC